MLASQFSTAGPQCSLLKINETKASQLITSFHDFTVRQIDSVVHSIWFCAEQQMTCLENKEMWLEQGFN